MANEIRQSIVEATIEKYRHLGDKKDIAARTYAEKSLDRKNEELDVRKILEDRTEEDMMKKELNQAAEIVLQRINDKLRGTEFPVRQQKVGLAQRGLCVGRGASAGAGTPGGGANAGPSAAGLRDVGEHLNSQGYLANYNQTIEDQVDLLIQQATSHENLAQCYPGWCPYW